MIDALRIFPCGLSKSVEVSDVPFLTDDGEGEEALIPQRPELGFTNIRFYVEVLIREFLGTRLILHSRSMSDILCTYVHPSADCVVGWTTLSASRPGPLGRR